MRNRALSLLCGSCQSRGGCECRVGADEGTSVAAAALELADTLVVAVNAQPIWTPSGTDKIHMLIALRVAVSLHIDVVRYR
jgi:hypothetical protein